MNLNVYFTSTIFSQEWRSGVASWWCHSLVLVWWFRDSTFIEDLSLDFVHTDSFWMMFLKSVFIWIEQVVKYWAPWAIKAVTRKSPGKSLRSPQELDYCTAPASASEHETPSSPSFLSARTQWVWVFSNSSEEDEEDCNISTLHSTRRWLTRAISVNCRCLDVSMWSCSSLVTTVVNPPLSMHETDVGKNGIFP